MSHETLETLLTPVGLTLGNHKIHKTLKGIVFEASVVSKEKNEQVTAIMGTIILNPIRVSGKSPQTVRETLFLILKTNKIEVTKTDVKHTVVWNDELKKFEKK